jgi:hypothetical protein
LSVATTSPTAFEKPPAQVPVISNLELDANPAAAVLLTM